MDGVRKTYDGPLDRGPRPDGHQRHQGHRQGAHGDRVDEYVLPPDVTDAYKKAPRTNEKEPGEHILSGKWKGYTPPPMPKKQ